ncbi:MAG: excinuclease ABC subunit UvrC [Oscillospiraceae bacterium]
MAIENLERLRQAANALSGEPGVYLMRNKADVIIYIGKAKNLKRRVSSYFRAVEHHTPKVLAMVEHVEKFETIVTSSEFEALVLECSLIKLHTPKYNILLKDDKGYSYLRVDGGPWPRLSEVKQKADDGADYIGPYLSSWVVKQMMEEANHAFGLPTCNKIFPRDLKKGRPCLNFHLGQCMGVCRGNIPQEEYCEMVRQAVAYIRGEGALAARVLTERMEAASEALAFETAARLRDRLRALGRFSERQRVVYAGVSDQDVLAFVQAEDNIAVSLIKFRGEKLVDKVDFLFSDTLSADATREEFLSRYYVQLAQEIPPQLTLDAVPSDVSLIERLLTERAGRRVRLVTPQRGEGTRLIEMARLNAAEQLSQRKRFGSGREVAALDELAARLGLPRPPMWIESYDVSNIGSAVFVGAMVVFEDGRPKRGAYRRFAMKDVHLPDDYACMAQMLERRLTRLLAQDPSGGSFNHRPDLLLIDGGQGHVSTVKRVLDSLSLDIPVFGMVKDDHHRTRAIAADGGEIAISALRSVFTLVSSIQDETHRFAVQYARQSHQKSAFELSLTRVVGIGPARAKALYACFRTKKAILAADEAALAAVPGMTRAAAQNLRRAVDSGEI